jgi:hypothetical protein
VIEKGGYFILLSAMNRWPQHTEIQMRACRVFYYIGLNHPDFCCTVIGMGAIQLVLTALKTFGSDSSKQCVGSECLIVLCRH